LLPPTAGNLQIFFGVFLQFQIGVDTPREAGIIKLLMDGFPLREAAHLLKLPGAVAESCVKSFYCRARAVIG